MADASLQLKLSQKLALAPQLQQAIRLLQLNRIELRDYIQEALDANPILERTEGSESGGEEAPGDAATAEQKEQQDWELDNLGNEQWMEGGSYEGYSGESQIADTSSDSLREHLLWQINLAHFSDVDAAIAGAIVYGLDEDGYLHDSIEDVRASLAPELLVEEDEILAVLHRVQRLEPVGVATRDAAECIKVQLSALPSDTSSRDLALRIARDYLELVARHDREELRKRTGASDEALDEALDLIQSLEPRPGARYDNRRDEYLVPDVYVTRVDDEWRITLNPENDPGLKLNTYYIDLLRKSGGADADYLRGRMQEARWLMSSLELRNQTLMRVSQSIVEFQEEFLERGELAMKPLVLKDVSEAIGVHESTVSRATTRKYMLTPRGVFELKYFFSSHVRTDRGGAVSATAVKARLQILLENEPPGRPLSDQDLSELLRSTGIVVARRTVAKYREALGIGSSSERRRLYRNISGSH
ncbi:MAG: RNA polymerase factor sigma-54 [Xanthomonadales bacterium]|jgi:RNA polymerase sigma-54 factor|nr:RNA polymerase factor sigma-54 [Xanthomonadales bacterium]MDH3923816.1 RNA polymerase factor sigma-54 [Xanthomonadales bacterium]MDH3939710.1 RNA polymerase factor sigma-54 [Xanthomonadales bacterium]MDH4002275.1 RNA polymerase factor sigma-54 [Xanthomonadales bacterium]